MNAVHTRSGRRARGGYAARLALGMALSLSPVAASADVLSPIRVTFSTTECNGDSGMASVDVDRIERIQSIDCGAAGSGQKRHQVLVRPAGGANGFQAYLVTEQESQNIERQIRRHTEARQRAIETGRTVIIDH